jgi:hypothetical protein
VFHQGRWFESFVVALEAGGQVRTLGDFEIEVRRLGGHLAWCPRLRGELRGLQVYGCLGTNLGATRASLNPETGVRRRPVQVGPYARALGALGAYAQLGSKLGLSIEGDALLPLRRSHFVVERADGTDLINASDALVLGALYLRLLYEL